jgi:DNA-binding transcriptional regulator LsrR (DeoR family)
MASSSVRPDDEGRLDHLRLVTKVARLYHTAGLRQQEIAERLGLSQSRVSRLLQAAQETGIIRTVVFPPAGIYAELEDDLEHRYGLLDAHVVDIGSDDEQALIRGLGAAAAAYLYEIQPAAPVVGFTSWSRTLREMVAALPPIRGSSTRHVVELIGDIGSPATQHETALATQRFASLVGAEPVFIRAPGVVASASLREALLAQDPYLREALGMLDNLDLAITGLGPLDVAEVLRGGSNFFSPEQIEDVRRLGAVGQVNLRFLDASGREVISALDELVIGISLCQLRAARRSLLVAGGVGKYVVIRGALLGGWVNMLVTDVTTAKLLVESASAAPAAAPATG